MMGPEHHKAAHRMAPSMHGFGRRCRLPADLEDVVDDIDHPVLGHSGASIETGLVLPVERSPGLRDLDDPRATGS